MASRSKRQHKPTTKFLSYITEIPRTKKLDPVSDDSNKFVEFPKVNSGFSKKLTESTEKCVLEPRRTNRQPKLSGKLMNFLNTKKSHESEKLLSKDYDYTARNSSLMATSRVLETNNEDDSEVSTTFLSSSDYSSKMSLECHSREAIVSSNHHQFVNNNCKISPKRSHDNDDDRDEYVPKKIMRKSYGRSITRNDLIQTSVKRRSYSGSSSDYSPSSSDSHRNISSNSIKSHSPESIGSQSSNSNPNIHSSMCSSSNNNENPIDDLTVLYSSLENNTSLSSKPSSIEEALKAFICMGKKVANAISDTLKFNDEALLFKSSNFEKKCLSVVHALACRSRDLDEEDMEKILKLLDEEQSERKLFRETFLESLRISHLTNMALYNQMYRLLKTF